MCKLNDTIADILAEAREVDKILTAVLELKAETEERSDKYDSEEYEAIMWHYDCAIDGLKTAIAEMRDASAKLVEC